MMRKLSSISPGSKFFLALAVLVAGYVAWWWVDSAVHCDEQDQYNFHGICLMDLKSRAEQGDSSSQWFYGYHLLTQNQPNEEIYAWHRKAMRNAVDGLDIPTTVEVHCGNKVPGFEPEVVESVIQRIVATHPDAHLRLFQLYVYPQCGAFNLDKASAQIPLLNQCAHLTLERYFRWTKERNYAISPATRQAIRANLALCAKDVGRKEIVQGVAQEFMFVRQQDIDELSQSLNALEP